VSRSRFKVALEKPEFNGAKSATILIGRAGGYFTVRPFRQRKTYALPLAEVALMVLWRIVKSEAESELAIKGVSRRVRVKRGKL